jgi:serine protease Do
LATTFATARAGRTGRRVAPFAVLWAVLVFAVAGPAAARGAPDSFADLADRLAPAVVNISTTQVIRGHPGGQEFKLPPGSPFEEFREFFEHQRPDAPPRRATSLGSGFIIDPLGYVVTNNHVIDDADEITVILADQTEFKATVIGRDVKTDLALVKVKTDRRLPFVKWGQSQKTRVGDWVLAIGNPFGLGGSVTAGIVSARGRNINAGPYDDFIQTDAAINRGNSGGPMFNMDGEVIGINSAIVSPSGGSVGIGFAVPSSLAQPVISQLREFGRVKRGWLGVRIQTVTDEIAQGLGLPHAEGALVASVSDKGPAASGGIAAGDVILKFDGREVADMHHLPRMVAETTVGRSVPVELWHKNGRKRIEVVLGELPDDEQKVAAAERAPSRSATAGSAVAELGLSLSAPTRAVREKFKLADDVAGVVITEVKPGSPAEEKRLQPGDVIVKIGPNQAAVSSPADVRARIAEARKVNAHTVLVLVETEGNRRFVALKLDHKG